MVTSINDIIRAIRENPEARDELRRVLLTDELLAMPQRLSDLVTVVDAQGQRLSDLVTVVDAQGQRLSDLVTVVDAQGQRLSDLVTVVDAQGQRLSDLVTVMTLQGRDIKVLKDDMGNVKGMVIEATLQGRIIPFLSSRLNLRRATVVRGPALSRIAHEFEDAIEDASDRGEVTADQRERIYGTDVIVRARRRETGETVYVPVEASFTIDRSDVDRAANTAIALRQVFSDTDVIPAVYGEVITQGGATLAKGSGVSVFLRDPEPEPPEQ